MPSVSSAAADNVGEAVVAVGVGFVRLGRPTLRAEYVEAREVLDASDVLDFDPLPVLRMLPCVSVLRCPGGCSCNGDLGALAVLGRRPSNGPGAIPFIRFDTFSPPFIRGLRGAKSGLGSG